MNKRIRSMIDEVFSDMKMTAENLALRDELLANAQARFEDALAKDGEEAAFAQVAESLEDIQGLLEEMKRMEREPKAEKKKREIPHLKTGTEEEAQKEQDEAAVSDFGEALGKAFDALSDFSQAVAPEAKKLVRQMDNATGGMLGKLGRAAKKGMRSAQKAASEAIDRLSGDQGELVFDFGAKKNEDRPQEPACEEAQEIFEDISEEPIIDENGEIDEEALSRAVEQAERAAAMEDDMGADEKEKTGWTE